MKRSLLSALLLAATAGVAFAGSVQELYPRAMRAYAAGDTENARLLFAQILEQDPTNQQAAAYMRRIDAAAPANASLKKQTESLIVPKVDFRDASLSSVLDYLGEVIRQQSNGKFGLNVVRMFPAEYGQEKKITLSLSNVPLSNVLDYVAQLAGLQLDYQAHAIVMKRPDA